MYKFSRICWNSCHSLQKDKLQRILCEKLRTWSLILLSLLTLLSYLYASGLRLIKGSFKLVALFCFNLWLCCALVYDRHCIIFFVSSHLCDQGLHCLRELQTIKGNETVLSPLRIIFPTYTQRQSTNYYPFDISRKDVFCLAFYFE